MKKTITKEFKFHSAHKLSYAYKTDKENEEIFGKCTQLHGHTYKLFVTVSGEERNGMVVTLEELNLYETPTSFATLKK